MFYNIGSKIKILAITICWIGIIGSIITSIIMFFNANEVFGKTADLYITLGCIFLFLGPIVSFANSILIYGFGELIEQSKETSESVRNIAELLAKNNKSVDVFVKNETKPVKPPQSLKATHKWLCSRCGCYTETSPCSNCGYDSSQD